MNDRGDLPTCRCTLATPIGELLLTACSSGLTGVYFEGRWPTAEIDSQGPSESELPALQQAQSELAAYFAGTLREFSTPLCLNGTPFQQRVWEALRVIPFGEVVSYKTVAVRLGDAKAVRAVGAANGRNPIPIIVPCHRVVGTGGSLTGFGGGLSRKEWLLRHEGALPQSLES